ncbi:MAG: thioredoxin domain-containing protein [Parcubacteria group bacterium]
MEEKKDFEKKEEGRPESIQGGLFGEENIGAEEASLSEAVAEDALQTEDERKSKQMKNLISLVILLGGLLIGSLFVDVSQLVRGSGYSQKNLNKSDIFEANGKTWVAYTEPAVPMSVISDDACEKCNPSEVLVWLRRVMPTVSVKKVSADSTRGKELISQFEVKTLPAFIFDPAVEKTELYAQAKGLFANKNGQDILNAQLLGLPVGKYLSLPTVNADDATLGKGDSNVKVVIFSDFQCPYCKTFFPVLRGVMNKYQDKVQFAFKELPLEAHPQAADAALAATCAQDQGKFWEYADKLYSAQAEWGNAKDITFFKKYAAALRLNTDDFNKCLDGKAHQDKLDATKAEAESFAISGTPTIFVNDNVESGAITADQLSKDIDAQLAK